MVGLEYVQMAVIHVTALMEIYYLQKWLVFNGNYWVLFVNKCSKCTSFIINNLASLSSSPYDI